MRKIGPGTLPSILAAYRDWRDIRELEERAYEELIPGSHGPTLKALEREARQQLRLALKAAAPAPHRPRAQPRRTRKKT